MSGAGDTSDPSAGVREFDTSFRADLEAVLTQGHRGLRGLLLALAGIQLVERHRRRGLSGPEVAAASLAAAQVAGELLTRRRQRRRPWPILFATTVSSWLIFHLGRDGSDGRLAIRGWEVEWTNWHPLFARLIDEDHARRWSILSAAPHLGALARPTALTTRRGAITGIVLLGAADAFGQAFGTALRRRADLIDTSASELVAARSALEEDRISADWRERVVGTSTATLRRIRAELTQSGDVETETETAARVRAEYETLRTQMVTAGTADAVAGDWEIIRAAELERDATELAGATRRALGGLDRSIAIGSAAMVALGVGSSPPHRRRRLAAAPVAAHLALLRRTSRVRHLRGDRSTTVLANLDLAALAIAYHLVDMITFAGGNRAGGWATTSVASLAMPVAASASTPGGALLPAAGYGAVRVASRAFWARDDTSWAEVLNTSIYFAWMSWALFRAVDAIWKAEARLERWTIESGRHTAEVVMESNRRRVQLALHDHGVQTLRYLARNGTLSAQLRTDLLDRAISELSSIVHRDEARRVPADLGNAIAECVDGYRRFGLDPKLTVALGPPTGADPPAAQAIHDPVVQDVINQGLANVLAHSSDRHPVVSVAGDRLQLAISVSNASEIPSPSPPTLGFGLGQLDERVRHCGGTLRLGTEGGVTELRVTLPLDGSDAGGVPCVSVGSGVRSRG